MDKKTTLAVVDRMVLSVSERITPNQEEVASVATSKGISLVEAEKRIIASAVQVALRHTNNDEKMATKALVIVNGRQNRLPQCVKLLQKHSEETVVAAYEIKSELAEANPSIRSLCDMMSCTDGDMEGEAFQLRGLLEEIGMNAISDEQEWAFHAQIVVALKNGRFVESVVEDILSQLKSDSEEYEEIRSARSRAYHGTSV
jgi:hypothetical protein